MRRFTRAFFAVVSLLVATIAVAIPAAAAPSSAQLAKISIVALAHGGQKITRQPAILEAANGASYQYQGKAIRIPDGSYLVAASVQAAGSDTLVLRQVHIAGSRTIVMNAEPGRPVRISLTGVAGAPASDSITACLGTETAAETPIAAFGGGGTSLYAVPFKSHDVAFSYLASWTAPGGVGYDITGSSADGVPAHAVYRQQASDLARLTIRVRSGVNPSSNDLWNLGPGNYFQSLCSAGRTGGELPEPFSVTQYVTRGRWTSEVDTEALRGGNTYFNGFNYLVRKLAARHRYVQTYGAAVAGPAPVQPAIDGNLFRFDASDLFIVPGFQGDDECCGRAVATLKRGGHALFSQRLNEWRGRTFFQRTVTRAGWYDFDVDAARWSPYGPEPAGLLSPRVTVAWHFYIRPVAPAGNTVDFPVTVTSYDPRGLSMSNQAAPGSVTDIEFHIAKNGADGSATTSHALRTIEVLASFNGGGSWRRLQVSRLGANWIAVVHDPASGYVALRSIVTDVKGDRTVQTIYRAYGIAS